MAVTTLTKEDEKKQQEQLQQANKTIQSIMGSSSYTPGSAVTQAQEKLAAAQNNKPAAYENRWKDQLDTMLSDILNRKDFQYDVNADPLFQQYREQYIRNGQRAMQDTMGQAAQLTGGYGNSYAQQAGQQAYNGYMQGLTDRIPELYSLAMQAYNNKSNDMMNRYNALGTAEGKEYSRYQDSMNAYNAELERLQNLYNTERSYDYGQYRDSVTDAQQRWANAWAMFQAGQDTPEIRSILGLPAAVASSGGGGSSGSSGSSGKKSGSSGIVDKIITAYKNGDTGNAWIALNNARKSGAVSTNTVKNVMNQFIKISTGK